MTIVEVPEVVSTTSLAIPKPAEVADPYSLCDGIEARLPLVTDVAVAYDAKAKLSALDEYVAQTSKDGRARIAATMRRLEVRIGELIGAAQNGGDRKSDQFDRDQTDRGELNPKERSEFRLMAEDPETVEAVIAESTDERPASRRKIVEAVRKAKAAKQKEEAMARAAATSDRDEQVRILIGLGMSTNQIATELDVSTDVVTSTARRLDLPLGKTSKAAVRRRIENIRELAGAGHTSNQIAAIVGLSREQVKVIASREGIAIPADAVLGRAQLVNVERVIDETINSIDGLAMSLRMIWDDIATQDAAKRREWLEALGPSLDALNRFKKELSK